MADTDKYFASIVSTRPWEDLNENLRASESVELLPPFHDISEIENSPNYGLLDIIFVDVEEPDLDFVKTAKTFGPGFGPYMVFIADSNDTVKMRAAMQVGGRDFIVRPFAMNDIAGILQRAAEYRQVRASVVCAYVDREAGAAPPMHSRILTFFSMKDGIGNSTLACNFAIALAGVSKKRVCIVDLVLRFGDISLMLNLNPRATFGNLAAAPPDQISENILTYLTPVQKNIFLLAAPSLPEDGELVTPEHVSETLRTLATRFDYVVVDAPSAFSDISVAALDVSSSVFLMVEPIIMSIRGLKTALDVMRDSFHYPDEKVKMVLYRSNSGTEIDAHHVEKITHRKITYSIPSDFRVVVSSINQGVTAVAASPKSKFSKAVLQMAQLEAGIGVMRKNGNGRPPLLKRFHRAADVKP